MRSALLRDGLRQCGTGFSTAILRGRCPRQQAEPLTMALEHANPGLGWAVGIVAFGSVIAHTAVLLVFQLIQTRIFFSMARDGLLPQIFSKVHPRFRTPHISTILTGVFVGVFGAVASLEEMVDLPNIGTLFAFILVCAGIIVLRIKDPARSRPFRVPAGWSWTLVLYAAFAIGVWLFPTSALIPACRQIPATGTPTSACFNFPKICSTEKRVVGHTQARRS